MKLAYLKEFDLDVSEDGRIFNARTGREYSWSKSAGGYARVYARVNGKHKGISVHRAVALAFIPNPENKPDVNHKDGQKQNNHVSNLEWMTRGENMRHAKNTGLWNKRMGIEHVESRDRIIRNLHDLGVSKDIIENAFQLNRPVVDKAIRRFTES